MEDDGFVKFDEMYFDNEVVLDEEFMNEKKLTAMVHLKRPHKLQVAMAYI